MSINKINYFYLNAFLDFFSIRDRWVNYNHSLLRSYYVGGGHRFTWLYCIAILLTDIIKHQTLVTEDPKKIENREASGKKKNPCGARKIENISEPLPDMIGFICYTVIPQAVTRGWSGWGREAREQGGRDGGIKAEVSNEMQRDERRKKEGHGRWKDWQWKKEGTAEET